MPPAKPTNVVGSMNGTSFRLTWDAVTLSTDGSAATDLDHYDVKIESGGTATTQTVATVATQFDLPFEQNRAIFGAPRANIILSVRAVDKNGNTDGYTAQVNQTNAAPATPTGFTGDASVDTLTLKWSEVSDADLTGYKVYMGTTAGTQSTLVWTGSATSCSVISTQYGTDLYFRVVSKDAFGTESASSTVVGPLRPKSSFASDSTPPDVPTGLAATLANLSNGTAAYADVNWTAVADPTSDLQGYVVDYKPTSDTAWSSVTVDYTKTSTRITGLPAYTSMDFRIRSSDFSANYSAWSATLTKSAVSATAPAAPTGLVLTAAKGSLQIDWTANTEANLKNYVVQVSKVSGFSPVASYNAGTNTLAVNGLDQNQIYYVRVQAVNNAGQASAWSTVSNVTTGTFAVSFADIIAGTMTSKQFIVGAGGEINIDATGRIISNNYVAGTTGYKLDSAGLEVNDGTIDAKTLKANSAIIGDIIVGRSADANGAVKSFGYVANTTGWKIDKSGIELNDGKVAAKALQIQSSPNYAPAAYSSFENVPSYYSSSGFGSSSASATVVTTGGKFGTNALQVNYTAGDGATIYLSPGNSSTVTYNAFVDPTVGKEYIVSAYFKAGTATAGASGLKVRWETGPSTYVETGTTSVAVTDQANYVRYSAAVTVPASATGNITIGVVNRNAANNTVYVDGVQIEQKIGGINTPGSYSMPGWTSIDGGIIRTGAIQSSSQISVNGVMQPAWLINMSGNAQFGDAQVRGKIIVGVDPDLDAGESRIASANFVAGNSGWNINSTTAEFNDAIFRGEVKIGSTFDENLGIPGVVIADGSISADKFAARIVIANVMSSSEDPLVARWEATSSGISTYDDNNVVKIFLPTDSGTPARFAGDVVADSLTVNDALAIRGTNNEISKTGALVLSAGTTKPSSPPNLINFWPSVATTPPSGLSFGIDYDASRRSLANAGGAPLYYIQGWFGYGDIIRSFTSKTDGTMRDPYTYTTETGLGSATLCAIGTDIWVFGVKKDSAGVEYGYLQKYNSTTPVMTKTFEKKMFKTYYDDAYAIVTNGTDLYLVTTDDPDVALKDKVTMKRYNTSGIYQQTYVGPARTDKITAASLGNFDFGALTLLIASSSSSYIWGYDATSTLTYNANKIFAAGDISTGTAGIYWDGSQIYSHNGGQYKLYSYGASLWTGNNKSTVWYGGTWYDNNPTGGNKETQVSAFRSFSAERRAGAKVSTPTTPLDDGTPDTPNAMRIYAQRVDTKPASSGATMHLQTTVVAPSTSSTFTMAFPGSVTPPPVTNTFVAGSPGKITAYDPALLSLNGDGSGVWGGMSVTSTGGITFPGTDVTLAETALWTAYTPEWSNSAGAILGIGNGSITGRYRKIGRTVHLKVLMTLGSSSGQGASGNYFRWKLPVAAEWPMTGSGLIVKASNAQYPCVAFTPSMDYIQLNSTLAATSKIGVGVPVSWGNGDKFVFSVTYEATS